MKAEEYEEENKEEKIEKNKEENEEKNKKNEERNEDELIAIEGVQSISSKENEGSLGIDYFSPIRQHIT